MTPEEKAKAYDEALERAKKYNIDNAYACQGTIVKLIFPVLYESEDERIRKELYAVINDLILPDDQKARFNGWLEKQKERGPLTKEEEYIIHRIIEYLEDETCPSEWIGLLHDIYCLPYEKQKEQKSRIDACGFPLRDEGESACSYLERCLSPDMRNIWYEACSEIKEKQQEQKLVDDNQVFLKGLMRVRDDKTLTEWEKQFDNIADKYAHNKNKEGYNQSWYIKERAAEMLHFAKKELEQKPTECIKTEELAKHIKAEFESFRNLLKKKGIDYQPAETYWTDFARLFVSSAKKLQKPAECSAEDELMRTAVIQTLERFGGCGTTGMQIDWLKSLPERFNPQPKQEWNEQNKKWFDAIIKDYEESLSGDEEHDPAIQIKINLLKSLRPSWKPSEEQMEALRAAFTVGNLWNIPWAYSSLKELYEQLKKLI